LKCDVDILAIELHFSQHLPNGSPILPKSVSFMFEWMNCNPFDAPLIHRPQGHCLGVEPYFLYR
jgi:hypothetical protein